MSPRKARIFSRPLSAGSRKAEKEPHQDQQNGNQQNGHSHACAHLGLSGSFGGVFRQFGVQVGEIPLFTGFLVLFVDNAAIDDTAEEHADESGNQGIEEENTHIDVHCRGHGQGRRGGQYQREGAGGGNRDGAAVGGHGVAGLAGENPEHGRKHDVNHVAEDRDSGDEASHGDSVLGAFGANGFQHLINNIVNAAGFVHEHTQHNAQAGDNADGTQGRAEVTGDTGGNIRDGGKIFRRTAAGVGRQRHQARTVGADQKRHKGIEF